MPLSADQREVSIINQKIRAIIAELRLKNEEAHQLRHTLINLLTIRRLVLEAFISASTKPYPKRAENSGKTRAEQGGFDVKIGE